MILEAGCNGFMILSRVSHTRERLWASEAVPSDESHFAIWLNVFEVLASDECRRECAETHGMTFLKNRRQTTQCKRINMPTSKIQVTRDFANELCKGSCRENAVGKRMPSQRPPFATPKPPLLGLQ